MQSHIDIAESTPLHALMPVMGGLLNVIAGLTGNYQFFPPPLGHSQKWAKMPSASKPLLFADGGHRFGAV